MFFVFAFTNLLDSTVLASLQFVTVVLGFPAGEIIDSLIGFENKGEAEFIITQIEGSLRCVE